MLSDDFRVDWLAANGLPAIILLALVIPLVVVVQRGHRAAVGAFDPNGPHSIGALLLRRTATRWMWLGVVASLGALVVVLLVAVGIACGMALADPATDPDRMGVMVYLLSGAFAAVGSVLVTPAAVLAGIAVPVIGAVVFRHLGLRKALQRADGPGIADRVAAARAALAGTGTRIGVLVLGIVGLLCAVAAGWVLGALSLGVATSLLTPPAAGSKTM